MRRTFATRDAASAPAVKPPAPKPATEPGVPLFLQRQSAATSSEPVRASYPGKAHLPADRQTGARFDAIPPQPDAAQPMTTGVQPVLMRQPSGSNTPTALSRHFSYDRSNFNDRFDGKVDAANHRVTLVMRLDIEDYGKPEGKDERIAKFRAQATEVIEKTWSYVYALQSVCHGGEEKFEARVQVVMDSVNPHHTVRVWEKLPGARSKSTEWQQGDLDVTERTSPVLIDPKKPPTKENIREMTFHQIPATHEFGHLMGLEHVVCASDADRCYGVTAEQKMDIMGYGSVVSERDYTPFVRIMERYGQDTLPSACNTWRLVSPG